MASTVETTLTINEIYLSLQGESTWVGLPCVFIRLTGCSLRCHWCDTTYAFHEGETQTLSGILTTVKSFGIRLVEITGGEPLEQEGVYPLMNALLDQGYQVMLETSGAVDLSRVPKEVIKIMDIKCPGSGEQGRNLFKNIHELVAGQDEIKFVLKDRVDYDFAKNQIRVHSLASQFYLLFSPVAGELPPEQLAEWILADRLPVRMQVQMHKVIWPHDQKGR